jgi:cobalt-zinc-cadmium efflux system protein
MTEPTDHAHAHGHDHAANLANRSRLWTAIAIIAVVLVVEVIGAVLSGSLALFADAGHMFSDLTGLLIALVATIVAARPATDFQTFGGRRAEVFGAMINGVILLVVVIAIVAEAVQRLIDPPSGVQGGLMLAVAIIGAVANTAALFVLRGGARDSINMRGAYLEVLGDLVGSIAVILAAIVILTTGFERADAIVSLAIAVLILPRALALLRDVVRVLNQSAPKGTDVVLIREHVLSKEGVVSIHDVHVWSITPGSNVFSAHVVVEPAVFSEGRTDRLLDSLCECLAEHFDVAHSTFQLEPAEHADHEVEQHR